MINNRLNNNLVLDPQKKAILANQVQNRKAFDNSLFNKELKDAAIQMEAIFLKQILKDVQDTPWKEDSLLGRGMDTEFYEDMHTEKISEDFAKKGGLGLANFIYKNTKRNETDKIYPPRKII